MTMDTKNLSQPKKPFSNIQLVDLLSESNSETSSSHTGSKSTNFSEITHISESNFTTETCEFHFLSIFICKFPSYDMQLNNSKLSLSLIHET